MPKPLRVCRIGLHYPTEDRPDLGLLELNVSRAVAVPTLLVARPASQGRPVDPPDHVTAKLVRSLDVRLWNSRGVVRVVKLAAKLVGQLIFALRSLPAIVRWHPDIVEIGGLVPLPLALACKIIPHVRVTAIVIGSDEAVLARSRFVRTLARALDAIFYVSPHMEPAVRRVRGPVSVLTPWGVDLRRFSPGSSERDNTVLTVSRLDVKKGIDYAIRAFTKVAAAHPAARLVVVGDGPDRSRLASVVAENHLGASVTFLGPLDPDAVAGVMATARVLLLPTPHAEGTPKVVLEAMASGLPVVATDVGACGELLRGGAGLVVPPRDVDALAGAVGRVLDDQALWMKMSERGPAHARDYSWDAIAHRVLDTYERLVRQPGATGRPSSA